MVRLYGPVFSLDASGTIADSVTFSKWKGRNYARQRVVPANPKSGMQTGIRAMLAGLSKTWSQLTGAVRNNWNDLAAAESISAFNAFIQFNQQRWANWKGPVQDPDDTTANGSAPVMGASSATGGPGCCTLSIAVTTLNDLWLLAIHHSLTGGFDRSIQTTVHVQYVSAASTLQWIHRDLEAGVHHYNVSSITKDGALAIAVEEFDGTAT